MEKFEYLENKKSFLDEISFIVFKGLSFGENLDKNLVKIADTSFKNFRIKILLFVEISNFKINGKIPYPFFPKIPFFYPRENIRFSGVFRG